MKTSKYNLIFEHQGKTLAFNSCTCALVEANSEFLNILDNCEKDHFSMENIKTVELMKLGNYIIEDDYDEFEHLKSIKSQEKIGKQSLNLIIVPTCTVASFCWYDTVSEKYMSTKTQKAIFNAVENAAKNKFDINVTWYCEKPFKSSEPLFSMSEKFINICQRQGVIYKASVITNDYFIDEFVIGDMIKARILKVQIIINEQKELYNSQENINYENEKCVFNKIIENIKKLLSKNINTSIRIDIGKINESDINIFFDLLKTNGLDKCTLDFGYLGNCSLAKTNYFIPEKYASLIFKYQTMLNAKGFPTLSYLNYPTPKTNYCEIASLFSYVIDTFGNMYKCFRDIGNASKKVGNIASFKEFNNLYTSDNFHMPNIFYNYKECKNCNILPICSKGCTNKGLPHQKIKCEELKNNLIETLKFAYEVNIK